MANEKKRKLPALFQSHGIWYFKISVSNPEFLLNPQKPKKIRKTISTESTSKTEAEKFRKKFLDGFARQNAVNVNDLQGLILRFLDPELNPMYTAAKVEGKPYTLKHAKNVARACKHLLASLSKNMPHILYCKISSITRLDCHEVREMIFREYGRNHISKQAFMKFKMLLTYAADIGCIPFSPAEKIPNIKPQEEKPIYALTPADIVWLYSIKELFPSEEAKAIFYTFATTGMRRSELAALTVGQIYRFRKSERIANRLVFSESWAISIDRAYKDDSWTIAGKPKWDKVRCIPISDATYKVLEPFIRDKALSDRVFENMTHHSVYDDFHYLRDKAEELRLKDLLEVPQGLDNLSPHKLRHALNTALSIRPDIKDSLSNEFMSWKKQKTDNAERMQSHYTHINVTHLCPIANIIAELYNPDIEDNVYSIANA